METAMRFPSVGRTVKGDRVAPAVTARGRAVLILTDAVEQLGDGREIAVIPATIRRTGDKWVTRGRAFPTAFDAVVSALETVSDVSFVTRNDS